MSSDINLTLGEKIAYYRRQKKLSQDTLGEKVGKSRQTINSIEKNKQPVTFPQLQQFADALEISVAELTGNINSKEVKTKTPSIEELFTIIKNQEEEITKLKNELENKLQIIEGNKKLIELYEKDISHYEKLLEDNEKLYNAILKKFTS